MTRRGIGRAAAAALTVISISLFAVSGYLFSQSKVQSYQATQGVLVKRTPSGARTRLEFSYTAKGQQHLLTEDVPSSSPDATIIVGGKHVLFYDRRTVDRATIERPSLLAPLTLAGSALIVLVGAGLVFFLTRGKAKA